MGLAIEEGIAIEETRKKVRIILSMYHNGFTAEQTALAVNKDIEEIKIIRNSSALSFPRRNRERRQAENVSTSPRSRSYKNASPYAPYFGALVLLRFYKSESVPP